MEIHKLFGVIYANEWFVFNERRPSHRRALFNLPSSSHSKFIYIWVSSNFLDLDLARQCVGFELIITSKPFILTRLITMREILQAQWFKHSRNYAAATFLSKQQPMKETRIAQRRPNTCYAVKCCAPPHNLIEDIRSRRSTDDGRSQFECPCGARARFNRILNAIILFQSILISASILHGTAIFN